MRPILTEWERERVSSNSQPDVQSTICLHTRETYDYNKTVAAFLSIPIPFALKWLNNIKIEESD